MAIERGARKVVRRPGGPRKAVFIEEPKRPSELRYFWMVIFGLFILFTESGIRQSMNGFVEPIMETFNCTKSEADSALLMIPMTSSFIFGPVSSMFYQFSGARISICMGAALCFAGFVAGTFTSSIYQLMVCGFFIGFGCGFMRNSIISVQCEYFKKRRDLVMACISLGPGFGIFGLPRFQRWLIDMEDWRLAWRVLSILYVAAAVCALFIRRKPSTQNDSNPYCSGFKLFKKVEFVLHLIASCCGAQVNFIYFANILILMSNEGIENRENIYGYQGLASIVGKLVITWVMGWNKIHNGILMIICYTIAQIAMASGLFCYQTWQFQTQNIFSGLGIGLQQACFAPFLVAIVGPSQLAPALGYTNFVTGLAIFSTVWLSQLASSGTDAEQVRGAFRISFLLAFVAITLTCIIYFILKTREKHKRKPSMKQMRHSSELNALTNITSVENS